MNKTRTLFILCVIFLTGCSIVTLNAASSRFKDTIANNKKHITIERNFSVVLSMDIIPLNSDVREAYTGEYSRLYMLSKTEKEKMFKHQEEENKKWEAFYLIVYTAPHIDSSLGSDSIWKMYVETDGHIEPPAFVGEITSGRPVLKGFFPRINSWDRVYLVKFARNTGGNATSLKFIITGILGKGEVTFLKRG